MSGCANVVEELEQEIREGDKQERSGTVERRAESETQRVTENAIRFAINSHICED
jgi:hypothetical protein